jgi:HAD superfamily hydrolase (TIGR01509 family)
MQSEIKAILFDMDGVLVDSEYAMFNMLRKTLKHRNIEISTLALINSYIGYSSNEIYASLIEKHGFPESIEEFRCKRRRLHGNYYTDAEIELMPGINAVLDYLRMLGVRMAVVSSTTSRNVLSALNRTSITKYFDAIVCGDMVRQAKPSPEGYLMAASFLQADVRETLAIEDSKIGIKAAKSAGIKVIGFAGSEVKQDISGADIQIASSAELLEWMKHSFESVTCPTGFVDARSETIV